MAHLYRHAAHAERAPVSSACGEVRSLSCPAPAAKHAYQPPKPGERIYKGHGSYRLMRELQLGVMFSIAHAGQVRRRAGCGELERGREARVDEGRVGLLL